MNVGFEYKTKKNETPFETFLRYTDEKLKSATCLAKILKQKLREGSSILDIGAGNGEYLELALAKMGGPKNISPTLVEPSDELIRQLRARFENKKSAVYGAKIVPSSLEDFTTEERFDAIIMSHMFQYLPRPTWAVQFKKVLSLLKPRGSLLIVLRGKDDAYDFNMTFKPLLFDESFRALVIDDVLEFVAKNSELKATKYSVASELKIPFEHNMDDTITIIEFYLSKQWGEIPESIQQEALGFIKQRKGVFKQLDGIAVIEKA
jgi:cyclopropane fatty-acyl-phospholipid synthase-like methyltransferase